MILRARPFLVGMLSSVALASHSVGTRTQEIGERWVLVYTGGPQRPSYTVDDLIHLMAIVDSSGHPTGTLCDGAILLDFHATSGRYYMPWAWQFWDRLLPYLSALEAAPDLRWRSIAIYEGAGALLQLSRAQDEWHRALYQRLVKVLRGPPRPSGGP